MEVSTFATLKEKHSADVNLRKAAPTPITQPNTKLQSYQEDDESDPFASEHEWSGDDENTELNIVANKGNESAEWSDDEDKVISSITHTPKTRSRHSSFFINNNQQHLSVPALDVSDVDLIMSPKKKSAADTDSSGSWGTPNEARHKSTEDFKVRLISSPLSMNPSLVHIKPKSSRYSTRRDNNENLYLSVDHLISSLTNVDMLKADYLSLSNSHAQKLSSQLTALSSLLKINPHHDTMCDIKMSPLDWPTGIEFYKERKGQGVKIHLVIFEEFYSWNGGKQCSNVIRQLGSTQANMQHLTCGLIVGPFLLHWNSIHSLCVPRKLTPNCMKMLSRSYRVAEIFDRSLKTLIESIAPEIVRWNQFHSYSHRNLNCQHFVDMLLEQLLSPSLVNNILSERRLGSCLFDFVCMMRLDGRLPVRVCVGPNSYRYFGCHSELDDHVRELVKKDPNFSIVKFNEYCLLTMMDQVFWDKRMVFGDKSEYQPLTSGQKVLCPCSDVCE
ncbi:hypothetical protein AKO1_002535 [Acrasis kona]|uniref:PPPDE domain-containing protein n=1 Tax=Acrasis kona TaxID=1008807 RepID=A0AAW2ZMY3_9EUKA